MTTLPTQTQEPPVSHPNTYNMPSASWISPPQNMNALKEANKVILPTKPGIYIYGIDHDYINYDQHINTILGSLLLNADNNLSYACVLLCSQTDASPEEYKKSFKNKINDDKHEILPQSEKLSIMKQINNPNIIFITRKSDKSGYGIYYYDGDNVRESKDTTRKYKHLVLLYKLPPPSINRATKPPISGGYMKLNKSRKTTKLNADKKKYKSSKKHVANVRNSSRSSNAKKGMKKK